MSSKADRFYFENFLSAADCTVSAAAFLAETLKNYDPDKLSTCIASMHEIEHRGDNLKHEMNEALAKAFVTPVDREDLALISENIDDVTDQIEEVLQRFYVDGIKNVLPEAIAFADKLVSCCDLMKAMLAELPNFKKPAKLREMIFQLGNAEEDCDALYLKALIAVRLSCTDVLEVIYWREIFDHLEACADACEHVGDCVATVVMKNT